MDPYCAPRGMDQLLDSIYNERGSLSMPPARLLRGSVLQALHGVRGERPRCDRLGYSMRRIERRPKPGILHASLDALLRDTALPLTIAEPLKSMAISANC